MNETVDRVRTLERLHDLGVHLIRVESGADLGADLENRERIAREDLAFQFQGGTNAAAAWGATSGGLINVAINAKEGRRLTSSFPETGLVFGRESAPNTNHIYLPADRVTEPITFRDTTVPGAPVLVEIRGDGSYDLVPPSRTRDGEKITLQKSGDPARARLHDLQEAASHVAIAALLAMHVHADEPEQVGMGLWRFFRDLFSSKEKVLHIVRLVATAVGGNVGEEIFTHASSTAAPSDGGRQLAMCVEGGRDVVNLVKEFLKTGVTAPPSESIGLNGTRQKQVDEILDLTGDLVLFHTPQNEPYASLAIGDHEENHPILRGGTLERILQARYHATFGSAAAGPSIHTAIDTLGAKAFLEGTREPVYTRIARHGEKIYIDLTNDKWQVIEIDAEGWRLVKKSPARFRRSYTALPLPIPVPGGSLDEFRALLNVDEDAWRAIVGFIIAALNPDGPYFVLQIQGEQGSAKSTATRLIKILIDPQIPTTRSLPRDDRDLVIAAKHTHVLSFDNLSRLSARHSDAFCRLSTGGGFATRTLYTNDDETVFDVKRPVILNGIEDLAVRGDLLDRSLVACLGSIPEEKRRREEDIDLEFRRAHPRLLGAVFNAVSAALKNKSLIVPSRLPRMADAALFVMAAEPALGWPDGTFLDALAEERLLVRELELEAVPLSSHIIELMKARKDNPWSGPAAELYRELVKLRKDQDDSSFDREVPHDLVKIGGLLRRIAPALREKGIEVLLGKRVGKHRTRIIEISKIGGPKPAVSVGPSIAVVELTAAAADAPAPLAPSATETSSPIATTAAVSAETAASSVVPSVLDDLEITEEVKQKRRTRKAA